MIPQGLFKQLSAVSSVSLGSANVGAHLSGPDALQFGNPLLRKLDLSNNPGIMGPLSSSWPDGMPALEMLTLSGISSMVSRMLLWTSCQLGPSIELTTSTWATTHL